mmetsp:Transcript_33225/g.32324  ORF Transcript_33225/g.32324 Transcript_33225/m.32324 type:complete len:96 (+) Transcript_33225:332-619(+)
MCGKWGRSSKVEQLTRIKSYFINKKRLILLKHLKQALLAKFACKNSSELLAKVPPSMLPAAFYCNYFKGRLGSSLKRKVVVEQLLQVREGVGWTI